jgi:hypothetical protein
LNPKYLAWFFGVTSINDIQPAAGISKYLPAGEKVPAAIAVQYLDKYSG